jgi:uncharacterized membrane protein YeaQ/YmgE (transglycosylase-associated protein family)
MLVNIIAWLVLGAIAGWIAGLLVSGDERWGVIGHVVLGIVGAVVGGFLAYNVFGLNSGAQAQNGDISIGSIVVAVIGAVIVVVIVNLLSGSRRTA